MDQAPLEKQLVHLDISGGVNERERPETAPATKTLTRVENLVQDQTGAYIKRPGLASLALADEASDPLYFPSKLMRLVDGLGLAANGNNFYHYKESTSKFLAKGSLPTYVVDSYDSITGSPRAELAQIYSVASSTKFHAIITDGPAGPFLITIYDRASGCVVVRYDSSRSILALNIQMVFVDDRYLHVAFSRATGLWGFVLDTASALPANEGALSFTHLVVDAPGLTTLNDYDHGTGKSFFCYTGVADHIVSMTNAAALEHDVATTGITNISNSGSGGKLWVMETVNMYALDPADISAPALIAAGAHGAAAGPIVATVGNYVYLTNATSGTTFGGGSIYTMTAQRTAAANGTAFSATHETIAGWTPLAAPFANADGDVFVHAIKASAGSPAPHVIFNITSGKQTKLLSSAQNYYSSRVECTLDPFLGVSGLSGYTPKYLSYDAGVSFCPVVPIAITARTFAYSVLTIKPYRYGKTSALTQGGSNYFSGGTHSGYIGDHVSEVGFVDMPVVNAAVGAGGGPTGAYKYIAVYKKVDETGAADWSRTSVIASVTLANQKADVTICPPCVTNADVSLSVGTGSTTPAPVAGIELYRTKAAGTQYYLCASTFQGTTVGALVLQASGFYLIADAMTDATLGVNPLLFRQPGTANSAVDRYPPPAGNVLCSHKDRLFTIDQAGVRVCYSSFFVDGEGPWYNPVFSFFVHGGSGPITGLVSMDGRLFCFKRDGVFVVDGDGPAEGGVTGNEFSPPSRLATEYGCIDHRSICVTTEGIVYRSARGIELLTRSLQVKWVGDRVQNTVNANPHTCAAVLDTFGRVHILVAASEPTTPTVAQIDGAELVWDIPADAWTVHYGTDSGGTYGNAFQDMVMADIGGEMAIYADGSYGIVKADDSVGVDGQAAAAGLTTYAAGYVPWVIETCWIRNGQQARQRVSNALLLAKKLAASNHAVKISIAYNNVDSYTQTHTWQPGVLNTLAIEELIIQPSKQPVLAIRLKIEELAPDSIAITSSTDDTPIVVTSATHGFVTGDTIVVSGHMDNITANGTFVITVLSTTTFSLNGSAGFGAGPGSGGIAVYPIGTGRGADVLGITIEIAAQTGTPKLAAVQKA